jgi:hypothetical protein
MQHSHRKALFAVMFLTIVGYPRTTTAQRIKNNFPDRRAIIVDVCPSIQLSKFSFENVYREQDSSSQTLTWRNSADQAVVAFEIVVLKYDAFNRRMTGVQWTVQGKDSADWTPLRPGEEGSDGTQSYGVDVAFTEIAYVRNVRFADGTLWSATESELLAKLRALKTGIAELGDLKPDPRPKSNKN